MIRTTRLLLVGAAVVLAGVLLSPVADGQPGAPAAAAERSSLDLFMVQTNAEGAPVDYMPVNSRGKTKPEMKDDRVILTFPMIELATGNVVGTIVDDIKSPIPGILFDVTTYFKFADGELVNHMLVSSAPDVQRPGWIIVGNRPENNSIIKATGVFEGRTGKIRLSGFNDLRGFPNEVYQDDFWVIELNK